DAMKAYADLGGRLFTSKWHNIWLSGDYDGCTPTRAWRDVATWGGSTNYSGAITDVIDETNNPKGGAFATWMLNVMGSTVRGEIPILAGTARTTVRTVDNTKAERWTYIKDHDNQPQNFQITTPIEVPGDQRCGKVVFSDMHVSGGP